MTEPLELENITGLSLTIIGVLIESYVKEGYADPTMYRALKATEELAEQFVARAKYDEAPDDFITATNELLTNIKLTAIECGEVVERIIEANGWQEQGKNWSDPHHDCDHDHNGED
jgi:hypothetical protein